jgi:hypothetical protein
LEVEREEEVKMTNGRHRVEPIYSTWTQEVSGREGVRRLGRDGANLLNSSLVRRSLSAATNSVSGERQVLEGATLKQTGGDQRCAEDAWENGMRVVTLQVLLRGAVRGARVQKEHGATCAPAVYRSASAHRTAGLRRSSVCSGTRACSPGEK